MGEKFVLVDSGEFKIKVTERLLDDAKCKYWYGVEELNKKVVVGTAYQGGAL